MGNILVGISEMAVTDNAEDNLVAYSLGSCIGVSIYDPTKHIGGIIHCMLPVSATDKDKAENKPSMFVDSGVPHLLNHLLAKGCNKKNLVVKVVGGATVMGKRNPFKIGERNYTICRKILWKHDLLIASEDVGGATTRSLKLEIRTGRTLVITGKEENEL